MAQEGADHDVLHDRHVLECHGNLEGAGHAEAGVCLGRGIGDVLIEEADGAPAVGSACRQPGS